MIEILSKSLMSIDLFGKPVLITFDKQKSFKTPIGGFLTLSVYSIILSLVVMNGIILLNRKQPKTSATAIHQIEAPLLNITEKKYVFSTLFLGADYKPFFDPSYFKYEISQFLIQRDDLGNSNISSIPFVLKNCSMYYNYFKDKNFEDDYLHNSLDQGYCFDINERELIIGGQFTGKYFSNINYRFSKCVNGSDFNDKNERIICKSQAEIDEKIRGGFFELYYLDNNIDLNTVNNPFTEYFTQYFILLDAGSQKFVDLYFKSVNVTSDAGVIFEDPKKYNGLVFDYYREQIDTSSQSNIIIDVYLNSSKNVVQYDILFLRFQDFAASIGGLMNILIQIGTFITMIFNENKMYEKMINSFFTIKEENQTIAKFSHKLNELFLKKIQTNKFNDIFLDKSHDILNFDSNNIFNERKSNSNFKKKFSITRNYENRKMSIKESKSNNHVVSSSNKLIEDRLKNSNKNMNFSNANNDLGLNKNKEKVIDFNELVNNDDYFIRNESNQKINNFFDKNDKKEKPISKNSIHQHDLKDDLLFKNNDQKEIYFNKINLVKKYNETKFRLRWYDIILIYLCPYSKTVKKNKILLYNAKLKLLKFVDYLEIVNTIQEFKKIKKIILSKEELEIFQFRLRPFISLKKKENDNKQKNSFDELSLIKSYKKIIDKSKFDEKIKNLIDNVDPIIKNIFDEIVN